MATRERTVDRAERNAGVTLHRLGDEVREARRAHGLSQEAVATAVGISASEVSRIERGDSPRVPLLVVARMCGAVGLDLVAKAYPGGPPIRDAAQIALLADFARLLHTSLRWDVEVPLPISGDQRAWDGLIRGAGWRFGTEAETAPRDAQALARRIQLKVRDGDVDGVLLLVRDTRTARTFLDAAEPELRALFPLPTRPVLNALRQGERPPGNGIVIVPRVPRVSRVPRVPAPR